MEAAPVNVEASCDAAVLQSRHGRTAQTETQVKFRFDDSALYAGFIASEMEMKYLADKVKEHDGPVWNDDCVELFLFDPAKNTGWHFAVNPAGTHFDGLLRQRVPGDPYRTSGEWNGVWESTVFRKTDRWEAVMKIPWKTLGYDSVPRKLLVNAARNARSFRRIRIFLPRAEISKRWIILRKSTLQQILSSLSEPDRREHYLCSVAQKAGFR